MKDLLKKFENKEPEIVFNWKDSETEAEGWTVINSLRGGAAGGAPGWSAFFLYYSAVLLASVS